ncbi:MAG: hypothetical protein U0838_11045 [Chloroflexota bacterium]
MPLMRIRMRDGSPVDPGPDDPGGKAWIWRQALVTVGCIVGWRLVKQALCG